MGLAELSALYHRAFNDRDFDVWREVFAEDVELVVDGMTFRGVDAAVAYGVGSATQFPGLHIGSERVVAESRDTVVSEIELVNGDPASGRFRRQGTTCEISRVRDGRIVSCRSYYMAAAEGEDTVRVPARGEATRVAEEQTALRRVATLVARGVSQDEIFAAVSQEIGWLVGADPASLMRFEPDDAITLVAAWSARRADFPIGASQPVNEDLRAIRESGRPWRWGPAELPSTGPFVEEARELGIRTLVGVPIVVEGRVWGFAFASSTTDQPFAVDAEARIAAFTELVAMAISNAQARADARRLGDEQAALRRVATLVARERPPAEIFATVGEEVGRVLPVEDTAVLRYEHDGTATIVATWGGLAGVRAGTRLPVDGENVAALVARTGRPARIDDYATASGALGTRMRELGVGAAVGCPIAVEGRLWGAMIAAQRRREPLPADTEPRLANFSDLVASAIANTQTRIEVRRLADEQAALRRVATVVARQPSPDEVFAAVTKEVGTLLRVDHSYMWRYEPDGSATMVAYWGELDTDVTAGTRQTLEGESVAALVLRSERPARIDDYASATGSIAEYVRGLGVRSAVGAPIVIEGRLWGSMVAASGRAPSLPTTTEARMGEFTELVATAISNIQARGEVVRLLEEQAALRRVATLVAEAASPSALLGVVVEEVGRLFRCDLAGMIHYESGGTVTATATWAAQASTRRSWVRGRSKATGSRRRSPARPGPLGRTTGTASADRSPSTSAARSASPRRSVLPSSSREACGARSSSTRRRRPSRSPRAPSRASWTSRSSSRPRCRTRRPVERCIASLTSRLPCDGWRRWSPKSGRRRRCSQRSPKRSDGSFSSRTRGWSASRTTGPRPSWRAGRARRRAPGRREPVAGGGERERARAPDRSAGPHRRFHERRRLAGRLPARSRRPLCGRRPDRRGRPALGRDEHRVAHARSPPGRHGGADGPVHRAGGHRDLEHRGAL